ncbi:expressed unknown protein (Partial), partial [Seminavis robusta]|eukprot:Sro819_g207030.1 n/a (383) ;mRNA; r:195-1461
MGSSQSKLASSPLEEISLDDISSFVVSLGIKYQGYGDAIVENAVDGELLATLEDDAEVKETLECLEITNFLHQRVLLKEWRKAKKASALVKERNKLEHSSSDEEGDIHKGREIETQTVATGTSSMGDLTAASESSSSDKLFPSDEVVRVLEELELQEEDHGLTVESKELEPYQKVANRALEDLNGNFGAVNLVSTQSAGHNSLCLSFYSPDGDIQATRHHIDGENDISVCRSVILGSNEDFAQFDIPEDICKKYGMAGAARYYGHVVKCGDLRVGMVCAVMEESRIKNTTDEEKRVILKFLAAETERQLQRRKVLVQRNENLKRDIEELKKQPDGPVDEVVLPAYGPLNPVMASQVDARLDLFPYPNDDDAGTEVRRSVELPA